MRLASSAGTNQNAVLVSLDPAATCKLEYLGFIDSTRGAEVKSIEFLLDRKRCRMQTLLQSIGSP